MTMTITDEKGDKHTHCHGVLAQEWLHQVNLMGAALSNPIRAHAMGLQRFPGTAECQDPDCARVNRSGIKPAAWMLVKNLEPVAPIENSSAKEKDICRGHPWQKGALLCVRCARMGMTKRAINAEKKDG